MNKTDQIVKQIQLKLSTYDIAHMFSEPYHRLHVDIIPDKFSAILVRSVLKMYERNTESETIEYPADWWQHFKQRWFPKWALSRWPVDVVRETVSFTELYPEFRPLPREPLGPHAIHKSYISERINMSVKEEDYK